MKEFFQEYRTKPWPKLEIPPVQRPQLIALVLFTAAIIALGWYIWFSPGVKAEKFLLCAAAIPILFFLKSRWVTIVGLLSFQVVLAFLFMGNSDYAIYIVLGVLGTILSFESPILMYLALVFAVWFDNSVYASGHPLRFQFLIGMGFLVGWIFRTLARRESLGIRLNFPERVPILVFFVWALLGTFTWSYEFYPTAWNQFRYIIIGTVLFLTIPMIIRDRKYLYVALLAWVVVGVAAAVISLTVAEPEMIGQEFQQGASALVTSKNKTAAFLAYSFFIALGLFYITKKGYYKAALFFSMLLMVGTIWYLQAKATVVGLAAGLIVFWIVDTFIHSSARKKLRVMGRIYILLSLALIFVIMIYFMGFTELLGAYEQMFFSPMEIGTMQFRFETWSVVLNIMHGEGHVVRGLGLGAFEILAYQYGFPYASPEDFFNIYHPHCLYLDIVLHFGIIGLLIYFWVVVLNMRRIWRAFRNLINTSDRYIFLAFFGGFISYYLHAFVDFVMYRMVVWALFMSLVIAAMNVLKAFEERSPEDQVAEDVPTL